MADAENSLPLSKKRAAGREISRDDPGLDDDDDTTEQETGTFKKASEEVLATRRIIKPRRHQPPTSTTCNPFASIRLVPTVTDATSKAPEVTTAIQTDAEKKPDSGQVNEKVEGDAETGKTPEAIETNEKEALKEKTDENEAESENKEKSDSVGKKANEKERAEGEGEQGEESKKDNGHGDASPPVGTPLNSFQQLSSNQNAFTGIAGTGFSTSSFSFGALSKEGSAFGSGSGSSFPSFNFGKSDNGGSTLFGTAGASSVGKTESSGFPSMQEVPVETGEENEKAVFTADAVLFEYIDGGWKERGKGEIKVNVATTGVERARLVMRARGNLRLILNASLFPDMKLANMDKRGVTFACMNTAGEAKDGLITFALKFRDGSVMEEFCTAVALNKGKKLPAVLKTPENSPKASDD